MNKPIYLFGPTTDGNATMRDILGGKGANLAEMVNLGISVPPGFTLPCEASVKYKKAVEVYNDKALYMLKQREIVMGGLEYLEGIFGFQPLMSVRSGARVSMPGMMDTILNVGLTTGNLQAWKARIGERAALDSYRRLIQMYSSVALEIPGERFHAAMELLKQEAGIELDSDLTAEQLTRLIGQFLDIVSVAGYEFPDTLEEQVMGSVEAVFRSWDNPRAKEYRKIHGYSDDWGTAVTIQAMVFGNMNDQSCSGVVFSRNFSTGENFATGEYLVNAQGEEVVVHGGDNIEGMTAWNLALAEELNTTLITLEKHYRDMQDVEFTVQDGVLYMLQTRTGKRTAKAAFKIAYDMAEEGLITKSEACKRVTAEQLVSVMSATIDPSFKTPAHFTGIAAGGGVVQGIAVFSAESAVNCTEPCILVTKETVPDDIAGMNASVGILTATGGLTSHAAVVARGMNKACVVGATVMCVNSASCTGPFPTFFPHSKVTIDGATGNVWVGIAVPLIAGGASEVVRAVLSWMGGKGQAYRVELNPTMNADEIRLAVQAATSPDIYVDTCLLESAQQDKQGINLRMDALRNALIASPATRIIIDLHSTVDHYRHADLAMLRMFGQARNDYAEYAEAVKVEHLTGAAWSPALRAKCSIKVSATFTGKKALNAAGYAVAGYVTTFADMMNPTGPMVATADVIAKVFGSKEAYECAQKVAPGNKFPPLPDPAYWYQPLLKGN